jgi:hypothetical protein
LKADYLPSSSNSIAHLEYKENVITLPSKEGIYYIAIIIESDQGNVLHSFKVDIKK